MNNEPVAWINENNHVVGGKIPPNDFVYSWKPLYTFPVIEIREWDERFTEDVVTALAFEYSNDENELNLMGFTQAILRKAQEK